MEINGELSYSSRAKGIERLKVSISKIWRFDIHEDMVKASKFYLYATLALAFAVWLFATPKLAFLWDPIRSNHVHIFHMMPEINLANEFHLIAKILLFLSFFRFDLHWRN